MSFIKGPARYRGLQRLIRVRTSRRMARTTLNLNNRYVENAALAQMSCLNDMNALATIKRETMFSLKLQSVSSIKLACAKPVRCLESEKVPITKRLNKHTNDVLNFWNATRPKNSQSSQSSRFRICGLIPTNLAIT